VGALALAAVFIVLAVAIIAGALLSGGDDNASSPSKADRTAAQPAQPEKKKEPAKKKEPKQDQPAAPAPAEEQSDSGSYDPARGAALNKDGFDLMNAGNYDAAISTLQEAVDSFPPGTTDLNYAYALFNLGKSLRLAGRYDEAIQVLEQRMKIKNQQGTVKRELELAKQQAKG
jgi:tetratricopeptide (TPR) repeat protein